MITTIEFHGEHNAAFEGMDKTERAAWVAEHAATALKMGRNFVYDVNGNRVANVDIEEQI
jgi:hypothetical protein